MAQAPLYLAGAHAVASKLMSNQNGVKLKNIHFLLDFPPGVGNVLLSEAAWKADTLPSHARYNGSAKALKRMELRIV